jgi:hypothetical protein
MSSKTILPGTGRGTAERSSVVEGAWGFAQTPLRQRYALPPPRPGEE